MSALVPKDSSYRYYNCNIQAPRLKADEIYASKISYDSYSDSSILVQDGKFLTPSTTFTLSPSALQATNCCGEISVYAKSLTLNISHILMITIAKTEGALLTSNVIIYQSVGNCVDTSSTTTIMPTAVPSGNSSVLITFPFLVTCSYVFRGF